LHVLLQLLSLVAMSILFGEACFLLVK